MAAEAKWNGLAPFQVLRCKRPQVIQRLVVGIQAAENEHAVIG